jgi:D-proline reductase (dithiol) PrdB
MPILEKPLDEAASEYGEWIARKRPLLALGRWSAAFSDYPYAIHRSSPFRVPEKRIEDSRVALLTTGGVHLASQAPFDLADPEGDLSFRVLPADMAPSDARLSHRTYEKTWAERDLNAVLPIDRLSEFAEEGETGPLAAVVSIMGSITNYPAFVSGTLPAIVSVFAGARADVAILVPL